MKAFVLSILIGIISLTGIGQNLVPNPSFEEMNSCPDQGFGDITFAKYWTNPTSYSPDYYNACDTHTVVNSYDVPNNIEGNQSARTGNAYAGIITSNFADLREYIQIELLNSLEANKTYCVEFYVSLGDKSEFASNDIGVFFSQNAISYNNTNNLPYTPQINNNPLNNPLTNDNEWTKISDFFTAQGGEKFLVIGNFKNNLETDTTNFTGEEPLWYSYHYVDDVLVNLCDDNNINEEENNSDIRIFLNPTEQLLNIESEYLLHEISLYNISGEKIMNIAPSESVSKSIKLDLSNREKGIYIISIKTDNKTINKLITYH